MVLLADKKNMQVQSNRDVTLAINFFFRILNTILKK